MDRCFMLLRRSQILTVIHQQFIVPSSKQRILHCSSSSSGEAKNADDCRNQRVISETKAKSSGKAGQWLKGRRRASLSPSGRLFAALSEESAELQHSAGQARDETAVSEASVNIKVDSYQPQFVSLKNNEPGEMSCEEPQEDSDSMLKRKRRDLSPLKRFSEMIPENYWHESEMGSSVKQDLDDLVKSDDSSKK